MILLSTIFSCPSVEPRNTPKYLVADIIAALEIGNLLRRLLCFLLKWCLRLHLSPRIHPLFHPGQRSSLDIVLWHLRRFR